MPAGVVVAGGRSTRFGNADKAVADLAGTPMVRRVADRVAPAVESLVVNCRDDQRDDIADALDGYPRPVAYAIDREADRGPVAGIERGLRAVDAEYAFVAACDLPFLDPDLVASLLDRARGLGGDRECDAAVPRPEEWFEVLHAAYRADAMANACRSALDEGEGKIIAPLFDLDYVVVEGEELAGFDDRSFESVDTREALREAEEHLG
jgi:molybdopterin-guanine dinucleotide biosynthesis protein A